jgi:hypothetical protein
MEKIPYFSHSKLRKYREFANENQAERLCESAMFAYLRKEIEFTHSDVMDAGSYFEHVAGFAPAPAPSQHMHTKAGKLTALFERAHQQGQIAREIYAHLWTGAVETQSKLEMQLTTANGPEQVIGIPDFVDFENSIIFDLKFSGLLHNKYDGFMRPDLFLSGEAAQQAKTYSLMYLRKFNTIPIFQLHVWSSTKIADVRIFEYEYSADQLSEHEKSMVAAIESIREMESLPDDFRTNFPALHRCYECPIANTCKSKRLYPEIIYP